MAEIGNSFPDPLPYRAAHSPDRSRRSYAAACYGGEAASPPERVESCWYTPMAPGVYPDIQIQAWDGEHFAVTAPFTITVLGVGTMAVMIACRLISTRIPGPIVAMLGATATVFLGKLPVETIGTRFGGIPKNSVADRAFLDMMTKIFFRQCAMRGRLASSGARRVPSLRSPSATMMRSRPR